MIRRARAKDYPKIRELCAQKIYYDSLLLPKAELKEFTLQQLRDNFSKHKDTILVNEELTAYLVLLPKTRETITQEMQTLIFDYAIPDFVTLEAFLPHVREIARQAGDSYMVVHLQEQLKKEQIWFYRLGFRPELNRVVKPIPAGHRGPASPRYRARPARQHEHMFLVRVNAEYSAAYRPAGRDTDLQTIKANFLGAYVNLNLADQGFKYIILEELETGRAAGYIILIEHELPITKTLAYYTYDVAVAPEFAGRGLSLYLCGAAETVLGEQGGGLIFGDTSLDNRAAVNGDRYLGFVVDSQRWGLKVDS